MKIPIEISARHIHLSKEDKEILFGKNYQFKIKNKLSQPNQYAAKETVIVKSCKSQINNVRIVGPEREQTQLEISMSDAYALAIQAPVVVSGDLDKSIGGLEIAGPKAKLQLFKGIIIPQRHLHIEPKKAQEIGIKNGQLISIKNRGVRSATFHNIVVRCGDDHKLSFQLDIDEANAAKIKSGDFGEIIEEQKCRVL